MSNRDLHFTPVSETPKNPETMNLPKSKVSVLKIAIVVMHCDCLPLPFATTNWVAG